MATVSLSNIKKRYPNGFQAIHGIDLEIADGEFIVMVGPSGCGKSTLLRMIAGLESITEGEMKIDQTRVNDLEPGQRDIAMVFQNYALYPHMSVFNNMAYGLRNRRVPAGEIEEKVKRTSEILELAHLLDRKPNQLSGGQRQRVAMGRAIVRNPKVFLFDEPLSNLDAKLRVQMRIEIRRLQRELGTTSVYVTHDQVEAMTLADRLVVMNEGLPEQIGTPLELYDRPASTFVAGFLGSPAMNFLPAKPGENAITLPDGTLLSRVDGAADSDFLLGVRPEHMQLCEADAADFTLKVDVVEPLGADTIVYGRMEGMKEELVTRLNGKVKVSEGDQLPLLLDREHLHMFNPDSTKRIG